MVPEFQGSDPLSDVSERTGQHGNICTNSLPLEAGRFRVSVDVGVSGRTCGAMEANVSGLTKHVCLLVLICLVLLPDRSAAQSVQEMMNQALKNPTVRDAMQGRLPNVAGQVPNISGRPSEEDIKEVQRLLNARGFEAGTPDGIAGAGTRRAISEFQASIGRAPTGHITREEIAILQAETEVVSFQPQAESEAWDMHDVQSLLTELDYDPGPIDGAWGRRSQAALEQFRQDKGSSTTGRPNAEDIERLRKALAPRPNASVQVVDSGAGPDWPILHALPVVDRSAAFSVAWLNAPAVSSIAIVPLWSETQTAAVSGSAPLRLSAPDKPGLYHVVMMDEAGASIVARLALEVR
ncbi:MAG: peptidoglycan-binding domain-containing protein [Bacteroidota bacterium]